MKYAIHAYEALYDGLYGIYSDFVVEVRNRRMALALSRSKSFCYS